MGRKKITPPSVKVDRARLRKEFLNVNLSESVKKNITKKHEHKDRSHYPKKNLDTFNVTIDEWDDSVLWGELFGEEEAKITEEERLKVIEAQRAAEIIPYSPAFPSKIEYAEYSVAGSSSDLPAVRYEYELLDALSTSSIILISGGTGSGKSTQVPQLILRSGYAGIYTTSFAGSRLITKKKFTPFTDMNKTYFHNIWNQNLYPKSEEIITLNILKKINLEYLNQYMNLNNNVDGLVNKNSDSNNSFNVETQKTKFINDVENNINLNTDIQNSNLKQDLSLSRNLILSSTTNFDPVELFLSLPLFTGDRVTEVKKSLAVLGRYIQGQDVITSDEQTKYIEIIQHQITEFELFIEKYTTDLSTEEKYYISTFSGLSSYNFQEEKKIYNYADLYKYISWCKLIEDKISSSRNRDLLSEKLQLLYNQTDFSLHDINLQNIIISYIKCLLDCEIKIAVEIAVSITFLEGPWSLAEKAIIHKYNLKPIIPNPICQIALTQPRRIACRGVAERLRDELWPQAVEYHMQHFFSGDKTKRPLRVLTEGILQRELIDDILLSKYDIIILDEAHENSLTMNLLLRLVIHSVNLRRELWQQQYSEWKKGVPWGEYFVSTNSSYENAFLLRSNNSIESIAKKADIFYGSDTYIKAAEELYTWRDIVITKFEQDDDAEITPISKQALQLQSWLLFNEISDTLELPNGRNEHNCAFSFQFVQKPLKLLIMSATLDLEALIDLEVPRVCIDGSAFKVDIHYDLDEPKTSECIAKKVLQIHENLPPGAILVFLDGLASINGVTNSINDLIDDDLESNYKGGFSFKGEALPEDIENANLLVVEPELINLKNNSDISTYNRDPLDSKSQLLELDINKCSSLDESTVNNTTLEISPVKRTLPETYKRPILSISSEIDEKKDINKLISENISTNGSTNSIIKENKSINELTEQKVPSKKPISFTESKKPTIAPSQIIQKKNGITSSGQTYTGTAKGSIQLVKLHSSIVHTIPKLDDTARTIFLSTNIAETSLTLPNIRYVVDTGKCKQRIFQAGSRTYQELVIARTSVSSATQRAGRCGRVGPGHCYRLYPPIVQRYMSPFPPGAFKIQCLQRPILFLLSLGNCSLSFFEYLGMPHHATIAALDFLVDHKLAVREEHTYKSTIGGHAVLGVPLKTIFAELVLFIIGSSTDFLTYDTSERWPYINEMKNIESSNTISSDSKSVFTDINDNTNNEKKKDLTSDVKITNNTSTESSTKPLCAVGISAVLSVLSSIVVETDGLYQHVKGQRNSIYNGLHGTSEILLLASLIERLSQNKSWVKGIDISSKHHDRPINEKVLYKILKKSCQTVRALNYRHIIWSALTCSTPESELFTEVKRIHISKVPTLCNDMSDNLITTELPEDDIDIIEDYQKSSYSIIALAINKLSDYLKTITRFKDLIFSDISKDRELLQSDLVTDTMKVINLDFDEHGTEKNITRVGVISVAMISIILKSATVESFCLGLNNYLLGNETVRLRSALIYFLRDTYLYSTNKVPGVPGIDGPKQLKVRSLQRIQDLPLVYGSLIKEKCYVVVLPEWLDERDLQQLKMSGLHVS